MSMIQIADKTTLDSTKTNTTNLLTKGGIKYNAISQKYQTYDTTNSSWVDTEFGGDLDISFIVKNYDAILNNMNITLSNNSYSYTETHNMQTNSYILFNPPRLGDYTLTIGDLGSMIVTVYSIGGVAWSIRSALVSFSDATDMQLNFILNLHYNDIIDISDIWSIGDSRAVAIDPISNPTVLEQQPYQVLEMVIIDFNHDELVTPINGHTRAAITLQSKEFLWRTGQMNTQNTNVTGWANSDRRAWCNTDFYNALPIDFKPLVKLVNKSTTAGNKSSTIVTTQDHVFLTSLREVSGDSSNEGSQYPYYKTQSNYLRKNRNGVATEWWTRSPYRSSTYLFSTVPYQSNSITYSNADFYGQIAPALSI